MLGARNRIGLTEAQIAHCVAAWEYLCIDQPQSLDVSEAFRHGSRTRYDERRGIVILGADAYRGVGESARARMSVLACLAHELGHLQRHQMGFNRPIAPPDGLLDEAEASIHAAFEARMSRGDRRDLVEDALDRLVDWLAATAR
jgi:hypothetical protein